MRRTISILAFLFKRYWLAWVVGCVTCLFLYLRLEPRPFKEVSVRDAMIKNKNGQTMIRDVAISKKGDWVAIINSSYHVFLSRFESNTLIDTGISGVEQISFDENGDLFLVARENNLEQPGLFKTELIRFQPSNKQKSVICSKDLSYHRQTEDGMSGFGGILRIGLNGKYSSLLSEDCQVLLAPKVHQDNLTFFLTDTLNGAKQLPLDLPTIDLRHPHTPYLEADFSNDHRLLLIQHSENDGRVTRYRLRWFDTATGHQLGEVLLPEYSRMVEPCVVGNDRTCGRIMSNDPFTIVYSEYGQRSRQVIFDEIADPSDRNRRYYLDPSSEILAYLWETSSNISAATEFHLSVRNLNTGQLLYSRLSHRWEWTNPADPAETRTIHAVLHGPLIMMAGIEQRPSGLLDEYIEKARVWLQLPSAYPQESALFIDAHNGRLRGFLRFPGSLLFVKHLPHIHTLFMAFQVDDDILFLEFDSHLRKPCGFILGWAIIVWACLTLLMEIGRATWRFMKKVLLKK